MDEGPRLDLVLKVAEVCNLNCTYCYIFNMADQSYIRRPKYMTDGVALAIGEFIERSHRENALSAVNLILHGGEPMMSKPARLQRICDNIISSIPKTINYSVSITTNATLIDNDWLRFLTRNDVAVTVSIDGPKEYNDRERLDRRGRGTYSRTIAGLALLRSLQEQGGVSPPTALTVARPDLDGAVVYRHLVDSLGFKVFDILLPDCSHDTVDRNTQAAVTRYVLAILNEWWRDNNPELRVRLFSRLMERLLKKPYSDSKGSLYETRGPSAMYLAIESDGTVKPFGELSSIVPNELMPREIGVEDNTVSSVFATYTPDPIPRDPDALPHQCSACTWKEVCRGGDFESRYSRQFGFNNRSVWCGTYYAVISEMALRIIRAGHPATYLNYSGSEALDIAFLAEYDKWVQA